MARPNPIDTVAKLVGVLVGCAVLCAGVVLPYVGGIGLVAGRESNKFLNTKCNLVETPPAQKTILYAKDGRTQLATLYTYDRELVPSLTDIPKYLQQALIATEDRRFYSHHGVDIRGLMRSAVNSSGGDTQGGSTLTMQYVKQVRYYQADTDAERQAAITQTLSRKMEDAQCALDIEKKENKDQILLNYLNIAFFGENSYGIGVAARNFFGVPVNKLTLPQAALLVGVVKAPSEYDPFVPANRAASIDRRNQVIQNLANVHDITQAQADQYKQAPLSLATTTQQTVRQGCAGANAGIQNAGFFCDYVTQWLQDTGMSAKQISTGGYRIVTTLDPNVQNPVQSSLWAQLPSTSKTTAIMPVVDPHTGNVLALATSKRYGLTNDGGHTVQKLFTDSSAGAGSTYKLFTMLAALQVGMPSNTQVSADGPGPNLTYTTQHCGNGFKALNDTEGSGFTRNETLQSAIAKSSNTYFVALEDNLFQDCELTPYVTMAQNLGISSLNAKPDGSKETYAQSIISQHQSTFTLGYQSTSPLDLAGAYATVANDGTYCAPAPVISIKNAAGQDVDVKRSPCTPRITPQVARNALQLLTGDTHANGTSAAQFASLYGANPGLSVAGKTGTVNASKNGKQLDTNADLWFAGVTPNYVATTALFDIDNPSKPISGIPGMSETQASHLDGAFAAGIWANAMTPLLNGQQWTWPDPNQIPNAAPVPNVVGQPLDVAQQMLTSAGFKSKRFNFDCGSSAVYGSVAYQGATNVAAPGSTILLCSSDNIPMPRYVPPPPPPPPPVVHKPSPPAHSTPAPRPTPRPGGGRRTRPPGGQ